MKTTSAEPNVLQNFEVFEDDKQLIKFAKIELNHIANIAENKNDKEITIQKFNECVLNVITKMSDINDPISLNALSAKIYNLRKYVDKFGICSDEVNRVIAANKSSKNEEVRMFGEMISYMQSEIVAVLLHDTFNSLSHDFIDIICGNVVQRIVYIISWIPLRTFKSIEDLEMVVVGGSEENGLIYQSSIAGRVYVYDRFSDVPYLSNGITYQRETDDGFEAYVCDESRTFVKFPLKSAHFIPTMIRIDKDEKVFKLDRSKYKKLKKRIVSSQPRFLQNT